MDLRQTLTTLDLTQAGLAREMVALGDPRDLDAILRQIRRMVSGRARVSGEMQALLGLMAKTRQTAS